MNTKGIEQKGKEIFLNLLFCLFLKFPKNVFETFFHPFFTLTIKVFSEIISKHFKLKAFFFK